MPHIFAHLKQVYKKKKSRYKEFLFSECRRQRRRWRRRRKGEEAEEEEGPAGAERTHRSHPGLVYSNNETANPEKRQFFSKPNSSQTNRGERGLDVHAGPRRYTPTQNSFSNFAHHAVSCEPKPDICPPLRSRTGRWLWRAVTLLGG